MTLRFLLSIFLITASVLAAPLPPLVELPLTPERNAASIRQLHSAVENHYSYRDLRGVDWDAQFAFYEKELLAAPNKLSFAKTAAILLGPAKDIHIWLRAGDDPEAGNVPTHRRDIDLNYNPALLPAFIPDLKKLNDTVTAGRPVRSVVYLAINSWSADREKDLVPVFNILASLRPNESLILDVRANAGGSESLAQKVAACFIDKPVHYASHRYHDPAAPGGLGPFRKRILQPNPKGPAFRGRVAVLMGPVNMSSAEAFLLMMKQAPNAALIGEKSYGSSGNPRPHPLANGVTVHLPSWQAMTAGGDVFEGAGIRPEYEVPWKNRAETDDPVLCKALELLGVKVPAAN